MKATISADPRLLALLGRKLYTSSPVVIAVRELLQNSVDSCIRKGVEPEISITVVHNTTTRMTTVTCRDNGSGMSEEELVNKFLCLGGSTKTGAGETGRFGVAKAVLMCGSYWNCQTLDNEVDSETVFAGGEIVKNLKGINGTEITCEYPETSTWNFQDEALMMVLFSSVHVHYIYSVNGEIRFDISDCGLTAEPVELAKGESWIGYGIQPVSTKYQKFGGMCFIRLNGLVQFKQWVHGNTMEGNLIIDIHSNLSVDDKNFPLVMSREKLSGQTSLDVDKFLSERSLDSATTDTLVKRSLETQTVKFVVGRILEGKRDPRGEVESRIEELMRQDDTNLEMVRDFIRNASYNDFSDGKDLAQYIDMGANFPVMRLHNYEPMEDDIDRDSQFINCWAAILQEIVLIGVKFGVGLIGDDRIKSEYQSVDNVAFFSLNPRLFAEQPTQEATVMILWAEACHEMAHLSCNTHNEKHGATTMYLMESSANIVFKHMARFTRILKG